MKATCTTVGCTRPVKCSGLCGACYIAKYRREHPEKQAESDKKYRESHREEVAARKRKYQQDNKEAVNAYHRDWAKRNPERIAKYNSTFVRDWRLKDEYDLSLADYEALLLKQGGKCAICERVGSGVDTHKYFHIDHDHKTGQVRGLLCQPCNAGIGLLQDNPELVLIAADYVERGGTLGKTTGKLGKMNARSTK